MVKLGGGETLQPLKDEYNLKMIKYWNCNHAK